MGAYGRRTWSAVSALLAALALVAAAAVGVLLAQPASAAPGGTVYVVHGLVGTPADILVDGTSVQARAAPRSVVGPLSLASGQHVVEFRDGSSVVVTARFTVKAGDSLDVVGHRASDSAMSPVVTVFRNDLSAVGPGKTRLVVSHVAVAPPADIRVDGKALFRNVANGESLSLVVPAGTYSLDVVPTVGAGAILGPVSATLRAGTLTRVFAVGNPAQSTADAIVQVLTVPVVGAGAPRTVHTGDGGQAADAFVGRGVPTWELAALTVAGVALAGAAGAARGAARSAVATGSRRSR